MHRRDISKLLLSSGLAASASMSEVSAQQLVERLGFPPTKAELDAKIAPKNTLYPEGDARRYGAVGDGISDDTAAVQEAVTFCIKAGRGLQVEGRFYLTAPINIDRPENGPRNASYFFISSSTGGGFFIKKHFGIFSSSLPFRDAPISVLTYFKNVYFESAEPGMGYVLDDGRFLRVRFDGCSFNRILGCNCTIRYTQSVQFVGCNMRFGKGTFWKSGNGRGFSTDDFKFSANIVEAWNGDVLNLGIPIGCAISNNLMEGVSGTAIITSGAQGLLVSGNYFEANGFDLDTTSGGWPCHGLAFIGNRTHPKNLKTPSVLWGNVGRGCVSLGNYSGGDLHRLPINSVLQANDFAVGSVWDNSPLGNQIGASWIPVDASGARLKFTEVYGRYSILNLSGLIEFEFEATYPTTASASTASIAGLPFPSSATGSHSPISGGTTYTNFNAQLQICGGPGKTAFGLYNLSMPVTNAILSGKTIRMFGRYAAAFDSS